MLNQALINYTTPVFSINKNGLISGKNYMAEKVFSVVKVGAIASRYTDIDFDCEKLSKAEFCGKEYSYFTMFSGDETLLFIHLDSFGSNMLPFDAYAMYKEKVSEIIQTTSGDKNLERRFIRATHSNLIKANYFSVFSKIFEKKYNNESIKINNKTCVVSQIYTGVKTATHNFLEDIDIVFDTKYSYSKLVANIYESDLMSLVINALYFCIINASGTINALMEEKFDHVSLSFTFDSKSSFDRWLSIADNSVINSSFALSIAVELAKTYGIEYSLTNDRMQDKTKNT